MNIRTVHSVSIVCAAALLTFACGNAPHDPDCCVQWAVTVNSDVRFGVQMQIDGDLVYRADSATQFRHTANIVRPADPGSHVIDATILAAETEPGTFTVGATFQRRPGGGVEGLLSDPQSLRVGEHMTLTVR
jgi:hypothetical protein